MNSAAPLFDREDALFVRKQLMNGDGGLDLRAASLIGDLLEHIDHVQQFQSRAVEHGELIKELRYAHDIIRAMLNLIPVEKKARMCDELYALHQADGATRANEREALLARMVADPIHGVARRCAS